MSPAHIHFRARRVRRAATSLALVGLAAGALLLGSPTTTAWATPGRDVDVGTDSTFAGTGFGPIEDGTSGDCPAPGAARDVTFSVSGLPHRAPADVRVTGLTFNPAHPYAGDLTVRLVAPDSTSFVIFGRTGLTTTKGAGDDSDLAGPYTFADDATEGWWAAATTANKTTAIASGSYRTSERGGQGATGANTDLTAAFAGVHEPNGTWTLRITDDCEGGTGTVSAASLDLTVLPPDCGVQQAAVASAQAAIPAAEAGVSAAQEDVDAADAAVASAQVAATTAHATKSRAHDTANEAQEGVDHATAALTKAIAQVAKATRSGHLDKIRKALKKRKAARAALKEARARLRSATADLARATAEAATADTALAAAQQTAADKHTALVQAQVTMSAAIASLTAAQTALAACEA